MLTNDKLYELLEEKIDREFARLREFIKEQNRPRINTYVERKTDLDRFKGSR